MREINRPHRSLVWLRACVAGAVLLVVTGCQLLRPPDPAVALLESELRWMEDNLYALDDQLDRCCEQLESARRNNQALREELDQLRQEGAPPPRSAPTDKETDQFDELDEQSLYDFTSPLVETGDAEGARAPSDTVDPTPTDPEPLPNSLPPSDAGPDDDGPARDDTAAQVDKVHRISLNRRLTGGYNLDGKPGHDGVMVVIEPQNEYADYVPVPGELLIQVTDPARQGLSRRIGKWRFDAVECIQYIKETPFGKGIHLRLPWPNRPPINQDLQLAVIYETRDGRKLTASRPIRVKLGTKIAARPKDPIRPKWSPERR